MPPPIPFAVEKVSPDLSTLTKCQSIHQSVYSPTVTDLCTYVPPSGWTTTKPPASTTSPKPAAKASPSTNSLPSPKTNPSNNNPPLSSTSPLHKPMAKSAEFLLSAHTSRASTPEKSEPLYPPKQSSSLPEQSLQTISYSTPSCILAIM